MNAKIRGIWATRRRRGISDVRGLTLAGAAVALAAAVHLAAGADPPGSSERDKQPYRAAAGTLGHGTAAPADATPGRQATAPPPAPDPAAEAAWQRARAEANRRVRELETAVQSGDPQRIRRAALEVQSDPLATHHINRNRPDLVEANNRVVQEIRSDAARRMREAAASEWNRANADKPPITADDVEIYQPRNWRNPNAQPTSPQDWDVTVRVRGQDLPPDRARHIVEKSFFDAAGGKQTFGQDATPESVAHRQRIETTSGRSPEAYNEPEKIIGTRDSPPRPGEPLKDPEQLTRTIEHKSNISRNQAEAARAAGDDVGAVKHEFDQMYQASKQYEKITKPRVEAAGGRVDPKVEEGMRILGQVGPDGISPAEARARLAQMGETPESIIQKASSQPEAAQKLGKGRTAPADAPDGGTRVSADTPEGRPRVSADTPDGRPRAPTDAPDGAPGKLGKVVEKVGKGMQAVDIMAGAEDAKKAIVDGDMDKLRETTINTADGLVGGPIGTARMAHERLGKNREEKNEAQELARRNAEEAYEQQMRLDLRKSGLSKDQVDAIMEARARGDEGPLKDAYEKAGKKIPEFKSPDPTVGETLSNYGAEVADNVREVKDGLVDRATKAKNFVTQTGKDLVEIGTGVTEKGVARELIDQQKERLTKDNLSAGAEHLAEKGKEFIGLKETDRAREDKAAKELADKLVEKGVDPETARKVAGDFIAHAGGQGTQQQLRDALEKARSAKDGDRAKGEDSREDKTAGEKLGDRKGAERVVKDTRGKDGETKSRADSTRERSPTRDGPPVVPTTEAVAGGGTTDRDRDDGTPRNDAGQRVDTGQYRDGDMIITRDGTEYEKRGDRWEKTGRSYGPYSPEGGSRGGLAGAEPAAGPNNGRALASTGGGLGGLLDNRSARDAGRTQSSLGLMGSQQNLGQASTRGDQASRDAQAQINAAGREAQTTGEKSAAQTASAQRDSSLGKAVADGVQQAVEKGLTSAADSFGKAAADKVSNSIFKDGGGGGSGAASGQGVSGPAGGSSAGAGALPGGAHVASAPKSGGHGGKSGGRTGHTTKGGSSGGHHGDCSEGGSGGADTAGGGGGQEKTVTVTCPACGRTLKAAPGEGVMCPYCVTMNCPRCGYSKTYVRGEQPDHCPMCYTTTCPVCGRTGWARRDQPEPKCPYCIRIYCSECGSLLYAGAESSAPASPHCATCARKEAEKQAQAGAAEP